MRLPITLLSRLKRVCRDGAGKPLYLTVADVVQRALDSELDRVEKIIDASIIDPDAMPDQRDLASRRTARIKTETCTPLRR